MKFSKYILGMVLATTVLTGCTNLDETLYDQVGTQNYYNTKMDVVRATFRPFEHEYSGDSFGISLGRMSKG